LGAAGSIIGGDKQASAAKAAAGLQAQEFKAIQGQEAPYMRAGVQSLGPLEYMLGIGPEFNANGARRGAAGTYGSLIKPFNVSDWQQLSPAYNFMRQQGQQGVLNGNAAGSGALSGAAQKDLMGFNQNLANESFNNAFNMYQTQQGNIYQRLAGLTQLGQNAAAQTGQQGTSIANAEGQAIQNYGSAMGGAYVGAANSLGGMANYLPWLMANNQAPPATAGLGG
jgi:hypothetical protein